LFTDFEAATALYERDGELVVYDLVRELFKVLYEVVAAASGPHCACACLAVTFDDQQDFGQTVNVAATRARPRRFECNQRALSTIWRSTKSPERLRA
jgi:class 3 adenylate cyclase